MKFAWKKASGRTGVKIDVRSTAPAKAQLFQARAVKPGAPQNNPMKSYPKFIAALIAACCFTVAAFAAETAPAAPAASPSGDWKWTQQGGNQSMEMTAHLEYKDGKLTGAVIGMQGPQGQIPDVAIADASFKDGVVSFTVTREFNGNKRTSKYEGKLEGDTIKGSRERPGRDGGAPQKSDWVATRKK
ncbi:MAG TPA: hypothetical protein VHO24_16495 [Opitutaceae bacterium]|nr:hypothetical protein [Opitutaceae bacterium]